MLEKSINLLQIYLSWEFTPCRILPLILRISLLLDREGRAHEGHFKDVLHHGLSKEAPIQVFNVLVSLSKCSHASLYRDTLLNKKRHHLFLNLHIASPPFQVSSCSGSTDIFERLQQCMYNYSVALGINTWYFFISMKKNQRGKSSGSNTETSGPKATAFPGPSPPLFLPWGIFSLKKLFFTDFLSRIKKFISCEFCT